MVAVWGGEHEKDMQAEKMTAKEDNQLRIELQEAPDSI